MRLGVIDYISRPPRSHLRSTSVRTSTSVQTSPSPIPLDPSILLYRAVPEDVEYWLRKSARIFSILLALSIFLPSPLSSVQYLIIDMPELLPLSSGYYVWHYVPSVTLSAIASLAWTVIGAALSWKMLKTRTWFCSCFIIGCLSQYPKPRPLFFWRSE